MTSDVPDSVSADLDILFLSDPADALVRAREALQVFRLIGLLDSDEETRGGAVSGALAFVPGRGLLVDTGDSVGTTPAQPLVDALSARLDAVVYLGFEDHVFEAAPARPVDDDAEKTDPADVGIQVFVVGGALSLAPDRRAELALQLESPLTVAPSTATDRGPRTLVVMHEPRETVYWSRAQRPVIGLRRTADQLSVQVYSTVATRTGRMRDRMATMMLPDWLGLWDPAPVGLLDDRAGIEPTSVAVSLQRRMLQERAETLGALGINDPEILAETGIDGSALQALLAQPLDDRTAHAVATALRVPREVAGVLTGETAAADLSGAVAIEKRGVGGTIADSLLAEPEGTSFWDRWRRLPHRHPRAAVALIIGELALAGAAGVLALSVVPTPPWNVALWIVAGVLATDAIGDAFLLGRIRRRA